MWFRASPDGEHVEINTGKGRAKDRHMRRDGRVTIQITDPENPYDWLTIYGKVDKISEEGGPEATSRPSRSMPSPPPTSTSPPTRSGPRARFGCCS